MNDKPFVYTFTNAVGYFLYDVNSNQVVRIKKQFFDALNDGIRNNTEEYKSFDEYRQMIDMGLLNSNRPEIIENPLTDLAETYLDSCLKSLIIQVTQRCNLRCGYCYFSGNGQLTRQHTNLDMTWETAKAAIDFFAAHSTQSDEITISFYGGEPLLAFSLIKKCVKYAEMLMFDKKIKYSITTNGTVITDEIVSFLEKYHFHMLLSMDGPAKVHNMFRRFAIDGSGSFEKVYSNLQFIKDEYPAYFKKVEINAVLSKDSDYYSSLAFFSKDPLVRDLKVHMNRISDALLTEKYAETLYYRCAKKTQQLHDLLDSVQNYNKNVKVRDDLSPNELRARFDKNEPLAVRFHHNGPCIPGHENLFIDIFGKFYPCVNASEHSKAACIGALNDGFYFDKVKAFMNIGHLSEKECKDCVCLRYCSICPLSIDNNDVLSADLKKRICKNNMQKFHKALKEFTFFYETGVI